MRRRGMIVSASYRTDIPAFYAEWFERRMAAGVARVRNPYGGRESIVDLAGATGFLFWSRNPTPFRRALNDLAADGRPFVLQMTIAGYPRALDARVLDADAAIRTARDFASAYGADRLVWRFDPILETPITPPAERVATFTRLADALAGATDEVCVSWATLYRKTTRNLRAAGLEWRDPPADEKRAFLSRLAPIAAARGMRTTLCSQPDLLVAGVAPAACVDAERLSRVAGRPIDAKRKGNRPGCACWESRDIGAYDSCPHGCVYCYAVSDRDAARQTYAAQNPESDRVGQP